MHHRPLRYHLFILGLWEESARTPDDSHNWRYTLEHSQTAVRVGFKSLEEMVIYLQAWLQEHSEMESPIQTIDLGSTHVEL